MTITGIGKIFCPDGVTNRNARCGMTITGIGKILFPGMVCGLFLNPFPAGIRYFSSKNSSIFMGLCICANFYVG